MCEQECIPVGCVPPAHRASTGGYVVRGVRSPEGVRSLGGYVVGGVCSRGVRSPGGT